MVMKNDRVIKLDEYEFKEVLDIINEKRNRKLEQGEDVEFITEILEKVIDSPTKRKGLLKRERETCER